MKRQQRFFAWGFSVLIMGLNGLTVMPAFSGAPPLTEEFLEASLPSGIQWIYNSSTEGQITLAGDSSSAVAESVPSTAFIATYYSGGNRLRGNYYQCDETVGLTQVEMYLGRSQSTEVTFVVYESSTSAGSYSLIASNVVTASVGTNAVASTRINAVLQAGKFYMIGMAWDASSSYRSGGGHQSITSFGRTLSGYYASVYPPAQTMSGSTSTLLYPMGLTISDNLVMRMDDSLDASLTSTNSVDLIMDLDGYTDVTLEFRHREAGDEPHAGDGVFLSDDSGSTFTLIYNLDGGGLTWQNVTLDIDALAAANGLSLTSTTLIRFQQVDNYGWPTDGREFDDIRVYSKPDLKAVSLESGGSTSVSKLWKGFSVDKQIPLEFEVQSRGGNSNFPAASVQFGYELDDSGGTARWYDYDDLAWSINAMEVKTDILTPILTIPAAVKLSDVNYTVHAYADALDAMPEALENNNSDTISVTVNHYSGWLWFDDVKADITISSWSTRVADSPVEHTISGTGVLDGESFSFTNLKVEKDPGTLDYSVDPTDNTVITVPITDRYEINHVTYWHDGGVFLSKNGAYANVKVLLPSGLGISSSAASVLESTTTFSNRKLNQSLNPVGTLSRGAFLYVVEETKPVGYYATDMVWDPQAGTFSFPRNGISSVRGGLYDALEGVASDLVDPGMAVKKSNEAYYRAVSQLLDDPVVETGVNGEALLSTKIRLDPVEMVSHFPYGIAQGWLDFSDIAIAKDLIDSTQSMMKQPSGVDVSYARDCAGVECAGSAGLGTVYTTAADNTVVGEDGGFRTPVDIVGNGGVKWGSRWEGSYAQQTDAFQIGVFYMPGHFVRGDRSAFDATDKNGPAEILLSGMASSAGAEKERPSKSNYADGLADYAGLNLRGGSDGDRTGNSVVGGEASGNWSITGRSKYYLRHSGVSGIHEAVWKSFPSSMTIYGYSFKLENYGLSYLSGRTKESRINGEVFVPAPCDIGMEFENLMLDCLGELEEAELANSDVKTLKYWDADIQPLSLFFAPTASSSCGNQARKLCMGLTTQCANIDQVLSGVLGFLPDGELGAPSDQIEGVPSRLAAPNKIELAGPGDEIYYFVPVSNPYYNDFSQSGDSMSGFGWINFAGNVDVSFFEDLQVHFQTSASTNSSVANIYMAGGWDEGGKTFFNSDPDGFDAANRGFASGTAYTDYRTNAAYRVHALRRWLGVIDFDYPLEWSTATKAFKSPEELEEDLLVVQVQHQTDYLSAENTEISFGVQYDGVPQINLANMAFNAVDEATGMASAFTDAIGDEIHAAVESGMSAFDDTLSDLPEKLFDPVFDEVLDPMVDEFYGQLYAAYAAFPSSPDFGTVVTNYLYGAAGPTYDNVGSILSNLANSASGAVNLLDEIGTNLSYAVELIDAFASVVTATNGVTLPEDVPGLLSQTGGKYETMADLGVGILSVLAETLYDSISSSVQEELNSALESVNPSLQSITEVLLELRGVVVDVQSELGSLGSVAKELSDVLNSPLVLDTVNTINNEIMAQLNAMNQGGGSSVFDEYTPEEVKAMLRQKITDAFFGSVPCADVQQVVRSQLYEVEASIKQAIDSAFQQLNQAMKDLVSEYLAGIDEEINGALGDLSDILGAGQIDGYAHIRHDSLNELRLDGKFQWKVPDEMEFNAFLIIKDLNSSMPGGCGVDADSLPEVTLGTTDFGLGMMGSDIRADISTKFAFAENSGALTLIGMGGSFEMTEGEIGFESFAIDEFYAAVAFGALENYLSASIHCTFTSYAVEGGIFLGKACSLDPFSWDPDVQEVLGDPPFLGVYVYGEGWMPIVDYGCLFRIKAGVGAGIFYFVDGPIGGKIFLGVDGEALCVVNVAGEVTLVGLKDGDDMRMKGKGKISGRVGSCPFCIKFSKTATIMYDNGDWDVDY